ncbi:hypothetical protein ACWGOQ_0009490 [Aquimarina sp. M1]
MSRVFTVAQDQYKNILRYYIADMKGIRDCDVKLHKDDNGIPEIKIYNKSTDIPLSLSSHGSFSAFAIDM